MQYKRFFDFAFALSVSPFYNFFFILAFKFSTDIECFILFFIRRQLRRAIAVNRVRSTSGCLIKGDFTGSRGLADRKVLMWPD